VDLNIFLAFCCFLGSLSVSPSFSLFLCRGFFFFLAVLSSFFFSFLLCVVAALLFICLLVSLFYFLPLPLILIAFFFFFCSFRMLGALSRTASPHTRTPSRSLSRARGRATTASCSFVHCMRAMMGCRRCT
jgi:hypothetical protein